MDITFVPVDQDPSEEVEVAAPLCGPCSRREMVNPDGTPRRFLLTIDSGTVDIDCPDPECTGPDLGMDHLDALHTGDSIPVSISWDGPSPGHVHWDQVGCDCDWYWVIDLLGPSSAPAVTA